MRERVRWRGARTLTRAATPGRTSRRSAQRGAAAVEFALVLPILLLLVFGIIGYGYMLSFRQSISQAAAEGARAAAVSQTDADRVTKARAAVNESLTSYGVTCSGTSLVKDATTVGSCSIGVATCAGEAASVRCVTVTLNYSYRANPLVPVPGIGIVLPQQLKYSSVARVS